MTAEQMIVELQKLTPTAEVGMYRYSGNFATRLVFQPITKVEEADTRIGIELGSVIEIGKVER